MHKKYCILLLLLLLAEYGQAQVKMPEWIEKLMNRGFVAVPSMSYAPETRLGAGVGGYWYFRTAKDSITRPSSLQFAAFYTQNKQLSIRVPLQIFFQQNRYILQAEVGYYKYPYRFFGVGNHIDLDVSELYTPHILRLRAAWLWQVKPKLFIGPKWRYESQDIVKTVPNGLLEQAQIPSKMGARLSALGAEVLLDERNNLFSPTRGQYIDLSAYLSAKAFGATYKGANYTVDMRKYFPIRQHSTFAVQAYWNGYTGATPFFFLSQLGGYYRMRGYFNGAYRDRHFMCLQSEARLNLVGRLGMAVFGSVGQVRENFGLTPAYLLPSGGVGLRFMFNTKERINMRLDYAIGKNSSGFYASIGEAF